MRVLNVISGRRGRGCVIGGARQRLRTQRGGSVVVVNFQRVMSESAMGRDMQTKLSTIGSQLQQEARRLNPEGQAIRTEERAALETRLARHDARANSQPTRRLARN